MDDEFGASPRHGFIPMVAELIVSDLAESLDFWCGTLGFDIAYRRPAEKFVYLEHSDGPQVMLCQRHGRFETGPMDRPFGRGIMLQVYVASIDAALVRLTTRAWPIYLGPRDIWRRTGDREQGQREVFIQDPDGYLIMLAHHFGDRPIETSQ